MVGRKFSERGARGDDNNGTYILYVYKIQPFIQIGVLTASMTQRVL